ncbi:MAG: hypothetical protein V3V08_08035 [Nannocystaceae bacterium]
MLAATMSNVPVAGGDADFGRVLDGPWLMLTVLVAVAVGVLTFGQRVATLRRRGGAQRRRPEFDLKTAEFDAVPVTRISDAKDGPVHCVGVIASSTQVMGRGRGCVWMNRAEGRRETAVAADLVMLRDASGQLGIENLESARVIAPKDSDDAPHDSVSLYIGDRVQVLGHFRTEHHGEEPDPAEHVYGCVGSDAPVQIRVLERGDVGDNNRSTLNHNGEQTR